MNLWKFIKNIFYETYVDNNIENDIHDNIKLAEEKQAKKILPPLEAYEMRRTEIQANYGQIEGIFYIYNGNIIQDHYSECLRRDKDNPLRAQMYHLKFYPNYMERKFTGLSTNEKSIPRGRIALDRIFIDACYVNDLDMLNRVVKLYRLPENTEVVVSKEYCCLACRDIIAK